MLSGLQDYSEHGRKSKRTNFSMGNQIQNHSLSLNLCACAPCKTAPSLLEQIMSKHQDCTGCNIKERSPSFFINNQTLGSHQPGAHIT
jgi:hypothetical protein